ncbi:hypothetical protein RRG08_023346 [Elysia crispata]|uniref:Uncharacterized protein n=1 Tax=Elysia crispata TaxID=231223 RepID=A0AAE1BCL6_9GAST|nr:hypothetical protein RRG08_023346 [Elysia crispata]
MKNFLKFKTRQNSSDLRKFGEEYYLREARLWRPFRLFGLFATICAMILILWAIGSTDWINGKEAASQKLALVPKQCWGQAQSSIDLVLRGSIASASGFYFNLWRDLWVGNTTQIFLLTVGDGRLALPLC